MTLALDTDVTLPGGVLIQIRPAHAADTPELERLIGSGAPYGAELVVAHRPWSGSLAAAGWWQRTAGPRGRADVAVAPQFARTPLAAHVLVRLARLADQELVSSLVLEGTCGSDASRRFVGEAFGLASGETEIETAAWPEAQARADRFGRTPPEPADEREADAAPTPAAHGRGVVIAGGGVAALECLMGVRDLAGPDVPITLVAPSDVFVYRPASVGEAFGRGQARRYPLAPIATDFGATLTGDSVIAVDGRAHEVLTGTGERIAYDALVLALGASPGATPAADVTVGQPDAAQALRAVVDRAGAAATATIAFVAPGGTSWTLPLYELALMTARELRERGSGARVLVMTPESRPLAVFGPVAGARIATLLAEADVTFFGSTYATPRAGRIELAPGGGVVEADAVVVLPPLTGPALPGVPCDDDGFIPTDRFGRVEGHQNVFAAGDATTFPVKQGGLAAQQADTVAAAIAAAFGAPVVPRPFKPVLRGLLLTADGERYIRAGIGGGEGDATVAAEPQWSPPAKIAGAYLATYLRDRDGALAGGRGHRLLARAGHSRSGRYSLRGPAAPVPLRGPLLAGRLDPGPRGGGRRTAPAQLRRPGRPRGGRPRGARAPAGMGPGRARHGGDVELELGHRLARRGRRAGGRAARAPVRRPRSGVARRARRGAAGTTDRRSARRPGKPSGDCGWRGLVPVRRWSRTNRSRSHR